MRPGFPERGGFADRFKTIDSRLAALERAQRLTAASIGSGGLTVKDDGSIQFLADDGTVILEIDKDAFTFDNASGTRQLEITPAGGMKVYQSNGTTELVTLDADGLAVGDDVQIDETGLSVIGGFVTPLWVSRFGVEKQNFALDTSFDTVNTLEVDPPDWVETVYLDMTHYAQISDGSSKDLAGQLDIGGGGFSTLTFHVESGTSPNAASRRSTAAATTFPITVNQQARVSVGTNSSNFFSLAVMAFGVRNES